jgi:ASC-1-like (ASCH) protein
MKWKDKLIDDVTEQLSIDLEWKWIVDKIGKGEEIGIHLAVFTEPFLTLVCNGEKKIESRFSQSKIAPFEKISKGDIVLMKESGGCVKAVFVVGEVKFYTYLNESRLKEIQANYGKFICSQYDSEFWESRAKANFATLIEIKQFKKLKPFYTKKSDRMAWSTLRLGYGNTLFSWAN